MKIQRARLLSEIRAAGFRFIKGKQRRSETYRQRGGLVAVSIPTTEFVADDSVRRILKSVGRSPEQIETFIKSSRQEGVS